MKVLVTGATGRIGSFVVNELRQAGHSCVLLDRLKSCDDTLVIDLKQWTPVFIPNEHTDIEAIVHLAAIPRPTDEQAEVVYANNVVSTCNVLALAEMLKINKIVHISSEAVIGVAYTNSTEYVKYLPIDEEHPIRPSDPYSHSKVTGELLCDGFVRMNPKVSITTLRFAWVLCPETYRVKHAKAMSDLQYASSKLFSYSDIRDIGKACKLAVECQHSGHERLFIAADDNLVGERAWKLCQKYFPSAECRFDNNTDLSLISCDKAKILIGYNPEFGWRRNET